MMVVVWTAGAVLVWIFTAIGAATRPGRSGVTFLLGGLGLGLALLFLGGLAAGSPPVSHAVLTRLLWSTVLLTTPLWASFSYSFGREASGGLRRAERLTMSLIWTTAALLLFGGLSRPPLSYQAVQGQEAFLRLDPPFGRVAAIHALAVVAIAIWNLHATLEAARAAGRRRVSLGLYALTPLAGAVFYLIAEALLYEQQAPRKTLLLLPASVVSLIAFAIVLRKPALGERSLPAGTRIAYAPTILVALGIGLVALAALAVFMRGVGVTGEAGLYEGLSLLALAVVFALWVFPGVRGEIERSVSRGFYAARSGYRGVWERIDIAFASAGTPEELIRGLSRALRATFGPMQVQLWVRDPLSADLTPVGEAALPNLGPEHPLRRTVANRHGPLVLTSEATRVDEVPLHLACEGLRQRFGLRVFFLLRAEGEPVGILGCGPAGGRTFHPEDLELLQVIAERLGETLGAARTRSAAGDAGSPRPDGGVGGEGRDLDRWFRGVIGEVRDGRSDRPEVDLLIRVPDGADLDRPRMGQILYSFLTTAIDFLTPGHGRLRIEVAGTNGVVEVLAGSARGRVTLLLPESPRAGEGGGNDTTERISPPAA